MTEYCLLAVAVSFPFYVYRIRGLRLFLLAGIICVGFAGLDEYHQSFVAGRSPGIRDVGLTAGRSDRDPSGSALLLVHPPRAFFRKQKAP